MSRTPLLSRFQQLYRDFAEHDATGTPIAQIQAARALRPGRRDFLNRHPRQLHRRRRRAGFIGDRSNSRVVTGYAKQFLQKADPVFPGLSDEWNGRATLDTPATNPSFLGSYSYWRVGQYTQFSGIEKEPSGHCYFAGEHCSTDFQGFMEGAAREGARAAQEVLASL